MSLLTIATLYNLWGWVATSRLQKRFLHRIAFWRNLRWFSNVYGKTNISASTIHCNKENACVNWMWQLATGNTTLWKWVATIFRIKECRFYVRPSWHYQHFNPNIATLFSCLCLQAIISSPRYLYLHGNSPNCTDKRGQNIVQLHYWTPAIKI